MQTQENTVAPGGDRRAHIEALLAQYPAISPTELQDLITWFRKEASALDVAMVASNEAVRSGYNQFKAEHIDPFRAKEIFWMTLFVATIAHGARDARAARQHRLHERYASKALSPAGRATSVMMHAAGPGGWQNLVTYPSVAAAP